MKVTEAILGRRSIRLYENKPIPEEIIRELIKLATYAPTGSNMQPWAFVVVEDQEFMKQWSDKAKEYLLKEADTWQYMAQYKTMLSKPDYNIFYNAPCLLLIYGDPASPNYKFDCSMAAQNVMLAAHEKGIGSCWIGLAMKTGNFPETKEKLGIPEKFKLIAPITLGYPKEKRSQMTRKEPVIFKWQK